MEKKKEKLLNSSQSDKQKHCKTGKSFGVRKISLYFIGTLFLFCTILLGVKTPVFAATGVNVTTHSKEEIRAYYKSHNIQSDRSARYKTNPSVKVPYSPGELSDDTLKSALDMLNFIRYTAGLDANVTLDATYTQKAQAGCLVNAVNSELSHFPDQPANMSDELYKLGYAGASASNLACGYSSLNAVIAYGWMDDGDDYNISCVGHRRSILRPAMGKTGFGEVGYFDALFTFDDSNYSASQTGVTWPAQNMPLEYFDSTYPWSYSYGEELPESQISVVLTRLSDSKVWKFSSSSSNGDFYVDNSFYGLSGCVIFRPSNLNSFACDDSFHVVIYNGSSVLADYQVNFFPLSSTGHKWSSYSIEKNATAISEGKKTRYCELCKKTETQTIAKLKATITIPTIPNNKLIMKVGQTTKGLKISKLAYGDKVSSIKSSNAKVVSVSSVKDTGCTLKARKKGTAKITIILKSGLKKTFSVTVKKDKVKTAKLSGATSVSVKKGKTVTLKPTKVPFTSQEKITYKSSNSKIATVSAGGKVKGKKKGSTTIKVKSGKKSYKVKIYVK